MVYYIIYCCKIQPSSPYFINYTIKLYSIFVILYNLIEFFNCI
nr:MAG TPA: hypothetical protein [Caudoviricetes sp.]